MSLILNSLISLQPMRLQMNSCYILSSMLFSSLIVFHCCLFLSFSYIDYGKINSKCYYLSKFRRNIFRRTIYSTKNSQRKNIRHSTKILSTNGALPVKSNINRQIVVYFISIQLSEIFYQLRNLSMLSSSTFKQK